MGPHLGLDDQVGLPVGSDTWQSTQCMCPFHSTALMPALGDLKIKRLVPVLGSSLSNGPFDHARRKDIKIKGKHWVSGSREEETTH